MSVSENSQARRLSDLHTATETAAAHQALMADVAVWRRLVWQGIQPGLNGELFELRECPSCASTLARPVSQGEALRVLAEHNAVIQRTLVALAGV